MEEVKLAEVISRVVQAVLGDLIPLTEWYNVENLISDRPRRLWNRLATTFISALSENISYDV